MSFCTGVRLALEKAGFEDDKEMAVAFWFQAARIATLATIRKPHGRSEKR